MQTYKESHVTVNVTMGPILQALDYFIFGYSAVASMTRLQADSSFRQPPPQSLVDLPEPPPPSAVPNSARFFGLSHSLRATYSWEICSTIRRLLYSSCPAPPTLPSK
ncbi:hypothetical protein F5141DRAFT_1068725 [Pisolithus sp. B1]|nr:hypothetical protein F5141DRAFT_1068725 [Pisolithus sp. B1]